VTADGRIPTYCVKRFGLLNPLERANTRRMVPGGGVRIEKAYLKFFNLE
jgi:hypothetical protein